MLISRQLANKITNRLMGILNLMRTGNVDQAADALHDLAKYVNRYVETPEEEIARMKREHSK